MPWQVIGHDWAVTLLQQSLARERLSHAYLLCGPPQVGKTTLARVLARALNCTQPDPPCGGCPSCLKIGRDAHPDVQVIAGRGAAGGILIDQIRALQRDAALAPYEGRHRVLILRQMDLSQPEAANSLLKTLEEPPNHVVLILTATNREALPSTIVSRCQCLDLRPVAPATIQETLELRSVPTARARLLAHLAGGRIGWAIAAASDDSEVARRQQDLGQLLTLLPADRASRTALAGRLGRDSRAVRRQVDQWISWWRDLLLMSVSHPHPRSDAGSSSAQSYLVNTDQGESLLALASRLPLTGIWAGMAALREVAQQLDDNVNPRLALEGLMLRLPRTSPIPGSPGRGSAPGPETGTGPSATEVTAPSTER